MERVAAARLAELAGLTHVPGGGRVLEWQHPVERDPDAARERDCVLGSCLDRWLRPTDRRNDGFFDLLSDDLVQEGIAVLAFDKRGTGRSTGRWETATIGELADDADAALTALEAIAGSPPRPSPCSGTARVAGLQPGYAAENDSAGA